MTLSIYFVNLFHACAHTTYFTLLLLYLFSRLLMIRAQIKSKCSSQILMRLTNMQNDAETTLHVIFLQNGRKKIKSIFFRVYCSNAVHTCTEISIRLSHESTNFQNIIFRCLSSSRPGYDDKSISDSKASDGRFLRCVELPLNCNCVQPEPWW